MQLFKKKVTISNFIQDYIAPVLGILIQTGFEAVENIIESGNYHVDKTEQAIKLELGIWIYHTITKSPHFQKLCNPSNSKFVGLFEIEILRFFCDRFGEGQNLEEFIANLAKDFDSKAGLYQKLEVAFSQSQIMERDLEATYLVNILGINYFDISDSSIIKMSQLHKMVVLELNNYLRTLVSKLKIVV